MSMLLRAARVVAPRAVAQRTAAFAVPSMCTYHITDTEQTINDNKQQRSENCRPAAEMQARIYQLVVLIQYIPRLVSESAR